MKKVLLATSALVAFGGAANAEGITLSGYAEIGIDGGDRAGYETQFHNDWQVNFNFSSVTDNGLEFGGKVQIEDLSSENNQINPNNVFGVGNPSLLVGSSQRVNGAVKVDDEAFWMSGDFGKVTLGDTSGAIDWAVPAIYVGTSLSDDHSTHAGAYWNTGTDGIYDRQIARYEYSFGDWAIAGSAEMFDLNNAASTATDANGDLLFPDWVDQDMAWGLGAKWAGSYAGADINAGIGYQSAGDLSTWSIGGTATLAGGFGFGMGYASFDGSDNASWSDFIGNGVEVDKWFGIEGSYTTGAMTFGVNYGQYNAVQEVDNPNGWGFVANYDMGGGAVAMFGYGDSSGSYIDSNGDTVEYGAGNGHGAQTWSAGVGMSF